MKKPEILFLPGGYDGCTFYRSYLPAIYGGMTAVTDFIGNTWDTDKMCKMAMEADTIVFQRPNDPVRAELASLLKRKGKKIVFENDDTYLPDKGVPLNMLASDKQREIAKQMNQHLYRVAKMADLCIVSTPLLKKEIQLVNPNTVVRINTIDPMDAEDRVRVDTGKFRIGIIGSVSSNQDYYHIKDQITELANRGDVTFVVLGHQLNSEVIKGYDEDDKFWFNLPNVEWHEFVTVDRYYRKLAQMNLDVALIPRNDSYFNRCKSNVKFLECSLNKIPVIAQGFTTGDSPYQKKGDMKYMQVVVNDEDWLPVVDNTIKNYDKYATLAEQAHDYVVEHYNIQKYAHQWRKVIEKLC